MTAEFAETIGLQALAWLLANDELRPVFLGATGSDLRSLSNRAEDPELLGSVLGFICMDDAWVRAFCDSQALAYDLPLRAQMALPGGAQVHWT